VVPSLPPGEGGITRFWGQLQTDCKHDSSAVGIGRG